MFPGQGSQSVGMLADLAAAYPVIRETFEEASAGADVDLWALAEGGPEGMLNRTEYTQPALLAADVAVWRAWCGQGGARPAQLAGHSLGEYAALVAAEVINLRDAAHLVRIRGQAMQAAVAEGEGAMAAVIGAEDEVVETVCREVNGARVVAPANYNSPGQIVIGGHADAVDEVLKRLTEKGVRKTVRLAVSVPSHTPLMREAAHRLEQALKAYAWSEPRIPVVQNVDARVHEGLAGIRESLVRQLYQPVRWTACVQALAANGATRIVECGPGKVLSGLVRRIDRDIESFTLGSLADFESALARTIHE